MPSLTIAAHLPLLRIEEAVDGVRFDEGFEIWRMPFEVFDELSMGAFNDHRARYEATAPLFLRLELPLPEEQGLLRRAKVGRGTPEIKLSNAHWSDTLQKSGLGLLGVVHETLIDRFCAALALVAPDSLPPLSRWSLSFMQAEPEYGLHCGLDEPVAQLRVQGDADLEYLFAIEASNDPLPAAAFHDAAAAMTLLPMIDAEPALAAALQALRAAAQPTLGPMEQELMSCTALEALLLPELRSGLAVTFAERAAPLLGGDKALAEQLYAQRSASLHDQVGLTTLPAGLAVRALAGALRSALQARQEGRSLQDWQQAPPPSSLPVMSGRAARERIAPQMHRQPTVMRIASNGLRGPDTHAVAIVPLVGLGADIDERFSLGGGIVLKGIAGSAMVSLEDKDIARDFLGQLHLSDIRLATLQFGTEVQDVLDLPSTMASLHRPRALAVCALRLAGFGHFIDPALAGLHALKGLRLLREPSVLRQTVLMRLRHPPAHAFTAADAERVRPVLDLLLRYEEVGRHSDAEHWLRGLRRLHHADFLPEPTRLSLGFALVEGFLGRFRDPADPQGPEQLARRLPGCNAAADWFATQARALRNALAHGRDASDTQALSFLIALLHAALPLALQAWLEQPDTSARPARLLRQQLYRLAP